MSDYHPDQHGSDQSPPATRMRALLAPSAVVFLFTAALYLPTLGHGFTNWDDDVYVTSNPLLLHLSSSSVTSIFTAAYFTDYLPLNLLSFLADRLLWGFAAWGYHLTNLLLHGANAALVYVLLQRVAGGGALARRGALLGALWFGLHPIHVESVAWVAERKNVLSQFFFLAAFLSYHRAGRAAQWSRGPYAASLALFVLALLSKSSVVMLPAILVAYHLCERKPGVRRTLPFFVLALGAGVLTIVTQAPDGGLLRGYHGGSLSATLMTLPALLVAYLLKLLLPAQLNAFYDFAPVSSAAQVKFWLPTIGLAVAALGLPAVWRYHRRAVFGLSWFVLGLVPVSNVIPFPELFAERYLYLPSAGLAICGVCLLVRQKGMGSQQATIVGWRDGAPGANHATGRRYQRPTMALGAACLAVLATLTLLRMPVWRDSVMLWGDTIRKTSQNKVPHNNLAHAYLARESFDRTIAQSKLALALNAAYPEAWNNLGIALLHSGRMQRAVEALRASLAVSQAFAGARSNLGMAYLRLGFPDKAAAALLAAVSLDSRHEGGWTYLGDLYTTLQRPRQAIAAYRIAISINARRKESWNNLGGAWLKVGMVDRATVATLRSLAVEAGYTKAWNNLGNAYLERGYGKRGVAAFQHALSLDPAYASAHNNLGFTLSKQGRHDAALAQFQRALLLQPGQVQSAFNIANMLKLRGRSRLALRWYEYFLRNWRGARRLTRRAERQVRRLSAGLRRPEASHSTPSFAAPLR